MANLSTLRFLAEQQQYAALRQACLEEAEAAPANRVLLALACAQLGEHVMAEATLNALDVADLDRASRIDLGAVHLALGDLERAFALLSAERNHGEGDVQTNSLLLARLGFCHQGQQRPEDAIGLFQRSVELVPRMPVFLSLLHLCVQQQWAQQGWTTLAQAERHWQQVRDDWPEDAQLFYEQQQRGLRLDLWLLDGAFEAAENWLEAQRTVRTEIDWCGLLGGYARRLQQRDRHAQAEERLRAGLVYYPDSRILLLQLVELSQLQGRTAQGIALLRRAIRAAQAADESTTSLWFQLATLALQHNPALSREAIERAATELDTLPAGRLSADQHRVQQFQLALARAELAAHEQAFDVAESGYRDLLAQQPNHAQVLQSLGQLLMQLGRLDEAVDCFEQVKAIDPARGHAALINARRFPKDDATLEQLEAIARQPGQEGSVRVSLLLQLAVAWEKRKDYEKAFKLAEEANAASRRLLTYDPQAHRQRCARIRHAFSRPLYEHRPAHGSDSTLPVFVVGMPRSGTTLVEQIIAGHSRIHGAGELGVMPRVITGLERWERHTGSGRAYPDCVDDLDPAVSRGIAANVIGELREYAPEADHVVDKLPHNFENIGLIKFLFPRAKIISVRRDPRDIAVSNFFTDFAAKHGGMGFAYNLDWIGEQLADHNLLMHHWQEVFPGEILEVRYEDVVANPEAAARKMLSYIGVEWEAQVLNFNELDRPVKTASVWQVRQPIYHSSREKWRRYQDFLSPLIVATNRKIRWDPIEMVSLPEPGWLNRGVDLYKEGELDEAERCLKKLLHFVPEHAAAGFMMGLIYCDKGHLSDGIERMQKALEVCPWNRRWRNDLAKALRFAGQPDEAERLFDVNAGESAVAGEPAAEVVVDGLTQLGSSSGGF